MSSFLFHVGLVSLHDFLRHMSNRQMVEVGILQPPIGRSPFTDMSADIENYIKEVDVLRGREMIRRHLETSGSLCYVIRRPGTHALREYLNSLNWYTI